MQKGMGFLLCQRDSFGGPVLILAGQYQTMFTDLYSVIRGEDAKHGRKIRKTLLQGIKNKICIRTCPIAAVKEDKIAKGNSTCKDIRFFSVQYSFREKIVFFIQCFRINKCKSV